MNEIAQNEPNVFNLRLYGVFGKYEDENRRFLSVCCNSILGKKPIEIWDNIKFDYLWVNDLVNIVKWFIEHNPRYKDYDICTSNPIHLSDWADTLMHLVKEKTEVILNRNLQRIYSGDNSRFLEECPFVFSQPEESLRNLYAYYKNLKSV